jgi:LysR family glycine cleavage system transcriptional activator
MRINRLPSLEALLTFREVARRRSFTAAARTLSVTQGAVSHRIRRLEDHLGQPLLHRTTRRVELSEAGRLLAEACDVAFDRVERALESIEGLGRDGRLVVSCSASFAIRWLVPHLPQLQQEMGGLEVLVSADDRLVQPGTRGVDLCIRYRPGGYVGVSATRLSVEQVTPVCSPALRADGRPLRSVSNLCRTTLLHDEVMRGHPGRIGWTRWLRTHGDGATDPSKGIRFSHAHLALEAAQAGQGVALARGILVARDLAEGRLVAPFAGKLTSGLAYWVLTPGREPRPAVARFRSWLLAAMTQPE